MNWEWKFVTQGILNIHGLCVQGVQSEQQKHSVDLLSGDAFCSPQLERQWAVGGKQCVTDSRETDPKAELRRRRRRWRLEIISEAFNQTETRVHGETYQQHKKKWSETVIRQGSPEDWEYKCWGSDEGIETSWHSGPNGVQSFKTLNYFAGHLHHKCCQYMLLII